MATGIPDPTNVTTTPAPERCRSQLRSDVRGMLNRIRNGEKVEHHETVRTNKDGQRIDVSLSISPVKSSKGTIIGAARLRAT